MTRDIRVVPTTALTAAVVALLLFVVQHPRAAMWACVVALVLAVGGLFTLAKEAIDLRRDVEDANDRAAELEGECQRLLLLLAEAEHDRARKARDAVAEFGATLVPLIRPGERALRAVPVQRDGHEPWPPIARAVEAETSPIHDDLAVETFVEAVDRWGVEADQ